MHASPTAKVFFVQPGLVVRHVGSPTIGPAFRTASVEQDVRHFCG